MKFVKIVSIMIAVIYSQVLFSDESLRKVYVPSAKSVGNVGRLRKVCSVDPDGVLNVGFYCKPDFLERLLDNTEIIKLKPSEAIELTTPLNPTYGDNLVYVVRDSVLFSLYYSRADGVSQVFVEGILPDAHRKFVRGDGWTMPTDKLAKMVTQEGDFKVGDQYCLKEIDPQGNDKTPVIITHLFEKNNTVIVNSVAPLKGCFGPILGGKCIGGAFKGHLTLLSTLEKCAGKLDPAKTEDTKVDDSKREAKDFKQENGTVDLKINHGEATEK